MVELLDPGRLDLQTVYDQEFVGMAWDPVSLKDLLATREKLINLIETELTEEERFFLLSVKQGEPNWDLLGLDGVAELPAVQWKLLNIRKMATHDHQQAVDKLKRFLRL